MHSEPFVVTEAATWIGRGRSSEEAEALAAAWRAFPDLPNDASAEDRMARIRARADALRPVNDAIRARTEAERQAGNFAFTAGRVDNDQGDDRDRAILRARDLHGYDWDQAVRYAGGWHAARVGWDYRAPAPNRFGVAEPELRAAYDRGFADGGGDQSDLFDAARRLLAVGRVIAAAPPSPPATSRTLPSSWPLPSDDARPVSWSRRLIVLSEVEACARCGRGVIALDLVRRQSAGALHVVIVGTAGFVGLDGFAPPERPLASADAARLAADPAQPARLRSLLGGLAIDDILIAAQSPYLDIVDAAADALPLCRTMERTRNTPLQQRAHLRTWLDRGFAPGSNIGAGHIRWGKVAKGLTGKLGELTARYAGSGPEGGHLIQVSLDDGTLATGFATADLTELAPEIRISNKARLREAMASALRTFGGATRLRAGDLLAAAA